MLDGRVIAAGQLVLDYSCILNHRFPFCNASAAPPDHQANLDNTFAGTEVKRVATWPIYIQMFMLNQSAVSVSFALQSSRKHAQMRNDKTERTSSTYRSESRNGSKSSSDSSSGSLIHPSIGMPLSARVRAAKVRSLPPYRGCFAA